MSKIVEALARAAQLRSGSSGAVSQGSPGGEASVAVVSYAPASLPSARAPGDRMGLPQPAEIVQSMAAIARMQEPRLLSVHEREAYRLITPEPVPGNPLEAFRSLRTEVLRRLHARNAVIMVTSVCARGGASFVAANLAVAFALDAARTALLIDGNLYQPVFGRWIERRPYRGLIDYLEDTALKIEDILHPIGIERLRVIPAGEHIRESIGEYFSSARMLALVQELRGRYPERMVIFDAPPMTDSADTRILSALCDGVVLVVPYGRVRAAVVEECLREIGGERLLGIVFNDDPPSPGFFWNELGVPWLTEWRERLRRHLPFRRIFARGG